MNPNPFAARNPDPVTFDASHLFQPPRLEKPSASTPPTTMIDYTIYCAGAPHLAQFSRLTGIPVFKLGIARHGAMNRIRGLSKHLYAGYWGRPGQDVAAMTALSGADAWVPIRMRRPDGLTVEVTRHLKFSDGGIELNLPGVIHPETVDRMLDDLLANLSLRRALATEAGQARLRNGGVDAKGWFYTFYRNTDRPDQLAEARELYVFEPRRDMLALAQGLAELVRHHRTERDDG